MRGTVVRLFFLLFVTILADQTLNSSSASESTLKIIMTKTNARLGMDASEGEGHKEK